MNKLESNFKNMFLVLFGTTLFSALALSITYNATKSAIKEVEEAKHRAAIDEVIHGFDEVKEYIVKEASGHKVKIYDCLKEGESIGVVVESYSLHGFSGQINVMVGFLPDGTIVKTVVLSHAETPGLGDKIECSKSDFSKQFWGKKITDLQTGGKIAVTKDHGKIDAITAATISSRAFCETVNRAWEVYQKRDNWETYQHHKK